jgi:hypothetical protein
MSPFLGASESNKFWLSVTTETSESRLARQFALFAAALTQPQREGFVTFNDNQQAYRIISYDDQFQSAAVNFLGSKLQDFDFEAFKDFEGFPFSTSDVGYECKDNVLLFRRDPTKFAEALLPLLQRYQEDFFLEIQTHSEELSQINLYVYRITSLIKFSEWSWESDVVFCDSNDAEALFLREDYSGKAQILSWDDFWRAPYKLRSKALRKVRDSLPWAN